MDLGRITNPLRLAKGSHQPGSGKGCAMNVISYINGDAHVTDFPTCSAHPLSVLVQACNDLLAGPDGYLSPENAVLALELAWQTVGTADVAGAVVHAWLAEMLTNPTWGVLKFARITAVKAILDIAELHRAAASGDMPSVAAWDAADRVSRAINTHPITAGGYALRAAYESTTAAGAVWLTADQVALYAMNAYALAAENATSREIVEFTRQAIRSWRELAGLDSTGASTQSPQDRELQLQA
ncbi:hypothetical protein [Mycobacterium sp. 852002-51163_SCH5372311]|uniref:hypothetical protein n=1 Tax=Mycobacterium sp. 852002-51163_SCH5372311 TaxID=1834097 RepID=UPI000ADDEFF7|nr:hypothetical protein [Mycobacterium sp. 852002-51163_SCH5372311]